MRPRRRRTRGPRPETPGAAPEEQSGEANVNEYQEPEMGGDEGTPEPQNQDSGGEAPGGTGGDDGQGGDFRQGRIDGLPGGLRYPGASWLCPGR